jgi:hypothetical protein
MKFQEPALQGGFLAFRTLFGEPDGTADHSATDKPLTVGDVWRQWIAGMALLLACLLFLIVAFFVAVFGGSGSQT